MADWLNRAVRSDLVVMCDVVRIELLRSARNSDAFNRQSEMLGLLPSVPMGEHSFTRALEVQSNLARRGKHRGVPPVDLLIAAAAEAAAIPLLHYDHDFDLISEVTGQPSQWVAPAGSLP